MRGVGSAGEDGAPLRLANHSASNNSFGADQVVRLGMHQVRTEGFRGESPSPGEKWMVQNEPSIGFEADASTVQAKGPLGVSLLYWPPSAPRVPDDTTQWDHGCWHCREFIKIKVVDVLCWPFRSR